MVSESKQQPEPLAGEIWRHWQGGRCLVICRATDEETQREVVVYQILGTGCIETIRLHKWGLLITKQGGERLPWFAPVEATPDPEPPAKEVPVAIHGSC